MCVSAAADAPSDPAAEADFQTSSNADGDPGQPSTPQLLPERSTETLSPPKTPSSVSLAESTHSHGERMNQFAPTLVVLVEIKHVFPSPGCGKLRPSRVQSVVSSQGSLDSDMQGEFCVQMHQERAGPEVWKGDAWLGGL